MIIGKIAFEFPIHLAKVKHLNVAALRAALLAHEGTINFIVSDRGEDYGGPKKTWTRVFIAPTNRHGRGVSDAQVLNHELFQAFPALREAMLAVAPIAQIDTVCLMRVAADEGLVVRHTDIALDKDVKQGFGPDEASRVHIPIVSNPAAFYSMWGIDGTHYQTVLGEGEVWYMDKRKPHAVENGGAEARIHFMFDVFGHAAFTRLVSDAAVRY